MVMAKPHSELGIRYTHEAIVKKSGRRVMVQRMGKRIVAIWDRRGRFEEVTFVNRDSVVLLKQKG